VVGLGLGDNSTSRAVIGLGESLDDGRYSGLSGSEWDGSSDHLGLSLDVVNKDCSDFRNLWKDVLA
jgi:hypothetical protein